MGEKLCGKIYQGNRRKHLNKHGVHSNMEVYPLVLLLQIRRVISLLQVEMKHAKSIIQIKELLMQKCIALGILILKTILLWENITYTQQWNLVLCAWVQL